MIHSLQVGLLLQSYKDPAMFSLYVLGKTIPTTKSSKDFSRNPIQAIHHKNVTHIFIRSQSNTSQLFYNTLKVNDTLMVDLGNDTWRPIGSSGDHLKFDAHAAVNMFLDRIEVFGVFGDNYVRHTWQTGKTSFYGQWKKLGSLFSPKFNSSPVAHPMGHSNFNGVLSLFVRGTDGLMRHIAQTTCDKQKNPWGPCTWGLFKKLGSVPPSSPLARNPFIASNSIHLGIEVRRMMLYFLCVTTITDQCCLPIIVALMHNYVCDRKMYVCMCIPMCYILFITI